MYEIKKQIYLGLTKTQKTSVCNYLRSSVKKNPELSTNQLWEKFFSDEEYYLSIGNSKFPFLNEFLYEDDFKKDTLKYLKECQKYYEYKEKQRPIIEANKEFEKKKRKFLQEVKMSKEKPTQKQKYYYEKLCKHHNIEPQELTSKLQAKNLIDNIIKTYENKY